MLEKVRCAPVMIVRGWEMWKRSSLKEFFL